jgi:hypothetical protein
MPSPGSSGGIAGDLGLGQGAQVAAGGSVPVAGTPGTGGTGGNGGAGAPISAGAAGVASTEEPPPTLIGDVAFSTPSQTFRGSIEVGMATSIAGAEIRYTIDGAPPAATSTSYAGVPISLTETTQLRAQPFVAGVPAGTVSTALYVARSFDAVSELPLVVLDGYGKGKPEDKEVYLDVAVMVFEPMDGTASFAALPTIATRAGYHVRGQSSANFPQTPYRVELWDNAGEDADHALLGMSADSDWALIPPYYDRALIRNPLVYELGREMGLEAPRWRYAEVYLNYDGGPLAESDYQGIYWITETIKNAKARTNLKQLRETDMMLPDISGGYIFKFDQAAAEEPKLACSGSEPLSGGLGGMGKGGGGTCWTDLEVVDPEPLNPAQETWLTTFVQTLHDALHATPLGDYSQYIDVPSFVDYLIINELTRNVDAYVRSAYYHKDRDAKLRAGPLWDYNFSLAVGGSGTIDPEGGWQYAGSRNVNNWYPKLTADPAFMDRVRTRYAELRLTLLSQASVDARITALTTPLTNAIARDYAKWPVSAIASSSSFVRGPTAPTWPEQVQALRDFVTRRLLWMDAQLLP